MDSRLHIASFTNTYAPHINGVARSVVTCRAALTQLGHNVFVFAQDGGDYEDSDPFIFRLPAVNLPVVNYPLTMPSSPFVSWLLPHLKLDVIHSHHPALMGNTAAVKAAELGVPLVFTFHTQYEEYSHYVPLHQGFVKGLIAEWLSRYLQRCHHVIAPSETIRRLLLDAGVHGPITTVPTGIDLARSAAADGGRVRRDLGWDDATVLVSGGRLAREKNWPTLLSAAAAVMAQDARVRLLLVGDGPQAGALRQLAHDLRISDRVHFAGAVPFDAMPDYLRAGDLLCFASTTETQGLVVLEAMAVGVPVAAVAAPGVNDIVVHEHNGLLTADDSHALADGMRRLLEDEGLYAGCAAAARATAARYDSVQLAQRLVEVYHAAYVDHRRGRLIRVDPAFQLGATEPVPCPPI